jgi:hypothetical protein
MEVGTFLIRQGKVSSQERLSNFRQRPETFSCRRRPSIRSDKGINYRKMIGNTPWMQQAPVPSRNTGRSIHIPSGIQTRGISLRTHSVRRSQSSSRNKTECRSIQRRRAFKFRYEDTSWAGTEQSVQRLAAVWRPRGQSSRFGRGETVVFSTSSKQVLGPIQPIIQRIPDIISGVKRLEREADHSPTTVKVKNTEIYTFTPHTPSWRSA